MVLRAGRAGRWTDRVEDVAAWVLLAAGLLVIVCGGVFGVGVYDRMVHQGQAEAVDRTPASATLRDSVPTIAYAEATGPPVDVHATWKDRWGTRHTGLVTAPQGLNAGSTVPIWIDRSGAAVPEPMSARDALGTAGITAGLAIVAGVMVLAVVWDVLRRVLMAYNCAAWEQEWRQVAPLWRPRRGQARLTNGHRGRHRGRRRAGARRDVRRPR
jgi:hypothetical protein